MTATDLEAMDLKERLSDIEDTVNEGFADIALKMGIGSLIEKTGARMVATSTVSAAGVNIEFDLKFTKTDVNTMSAVEAIDVVLVQEYAKVFANAFSKKLRSN